MAALRHFPGFVGLFVGVILLTGCPSDGSSGSGSGSGAVAPDAGFSATPVVGTSPLAVDFTDLTSGSVSDWSWDFGDGNSSNSQHPSHTYTAPGTYTVSLTTTGPGGADLEMKTDYIDVTDPPPTADFSGTPLAGTAPLTVGFSDLTSGNVTGWSWDFGDGGSATDRNPTHTFATPGTYDLRLTATGPGGTDTEVKLDYVTVSPPAPTADFSGTPLTGTAPLDVDFTDLSSGNVGAWSWDFGDGGSATVQNPSHTFSTPGTYDLRLTVTGAGGADTETKVDYVTVLDPTATVTVNGITPAEAFASGGTLVTIDGTGLAAGATITLAGQPCTNVNVNSSTQATCMTPSVGPAEVGSVDLTVALPGGDSDTLTSGFTFLTPVFRVLSPGQGSSLPNGTVAIDFEVENFVLGDYGATHLHYYIDGRAVGPFEFLNGATSEVHLNGEHTHFTHWTSTSSIEIFGLDSGPHTVEFVLAAANHDEFTQPSANVSLSFVILAPAPGVFTAVQLLNVPGLPVEMRFTGDGRLLYTRRQSGEIRVVDTTTWTLDPVPFYTLAAHTSWVEDGVLGLELDPDFATNGLLYASFTHTSGDGRIVRLRDANGRGTDETLLLGGLSPGGQHAVSNLRFGPDGMLYVSVGDGGQGPLAQDVNALRGKLLRIDPSDGSAPPDNPWPGSRAYAIGLRNPFGFDFHPDTGDIWLVDNGTDHDDELNVVGAGQNFGWDGNSSSMGVLGNACCVDPLWTTNNAQIGPTSLSFASSNTAYGPSYVWSAFFADNNTGQVSLVVPTGIDLDELGSLTAAFPGGLSGLIGLIEGPDGFLYTCSRNGGIYRLELGP